MNRSLLYIYFVCVVIFIAVWEPAALAEEGLRELFSTTKSKSGQIAVLSLERIFLPESYDMYLSSSGVAEVTNDTGRGYNWDGPPPESADWRGIKIDTAYFMAYQFLAIGVIYLAPESFSGWSQEDKEDYSLSKWWKNITNPIWDEDEWYVNYILHPYWGATFYIRAQERGFERMHSFWYAFLLSALYEFGAEALFEPVSYQDLIVTPVAGALLGEYVFSPLRKRVRAKPGQLDWQDKAVLLLTDPIGVANETLNLIFKVDSEIHFCRLGMKDYHSVSGPLHETGSAARMDRMPIKAWGLQLKINW